MNRDKIAFNILRILDDNLYHSGNILAKQLNCSRATVSNILKDIRCWGIDVVGIRGRGYCWHSPIVWLNKNTILERYTLKPELYNLIILDSIDSTNDYLLNEFLEDQLNNLYIPVVAAELQTDGRGRQGRSWYSGLGNSLTFSLRWRFEEGISTLSGLSLIIGLAVIRVLNAHSINNIKLKWPNDILSNNHKLAGVLIELRGEIHGPSFAVIGIGINFYLPQLMKNLIEQKVTDLFDITGKKLDRNPILGSLLTELRCILTGFEVHGFKHFKDEWISHHAYEEQEVLLNLPNGEIIEGTVNGVDDDGSISLMTNWGRKSYKVGDISLRLRHR